MDLLITWVSSGSRWNACHSINTPCHNVARTQWSFHLRYNELLWCTMHNSRGMNESYQDSCHVILRMSMRVRRTSMFLLRMWMHALNINDLCHERIRTPCQASATQRARSTNWYTRYPKIRTQYWHGHIPCSRIYLKTRQLLKGWYGIQRSLLKM